MLKKKVFSSTWQKSVTRHWADVTADSSFRFGSSGVPAVRSAAAATIAIVTHSAWYETKRNLNSSIISLARPHPSRCEVHIALVSSRPGLWLGHSVERGSEGGERLSCLSRPAPLTSTLPVKIHRGVRRKPPRPPSFSLLSSFQTRHRTSRFDVKTKFNPAGRPWPDPERTEWAEAPPPRPHPTDGKQNIQTRITVIRNDPHFHLMDFWSLAVTQTAASLLVCLSRWKIYIKSSDKFSSGWQGEFLFTLI